jgi:hypothetical protein
MPAEIIPSRPAPARPAPAQPAPNSIPDQGADSLPVLDVDRDCRRFGPAKMNDESPEMFQKVQNELLGKCIEKAQREYDFSKMVWPHMPVSARQDVLARTWHDVRGNRYQAITFYTVLAGWVRIWAEEQERLRPAQPFKP